MSAQRSTAASATLVPFLESEPPFIPVGSDAYIPVRVTEGPRPDGSVLVYLSDGTAFVVKGRDLLRLSDSGSSPTEIT